MGAGAGGTLITPVSGPAPHPDLDRHFGPLTRAEAAVVANIGIGLLDRLGTSPATGEDQPDLNVRAELIRYLLLGGPDVPRMHEKGIRLSGVRIIGTLDLEGCRIPHDIGLLDCWFEMTPILRSAVIDTLSLDGSTLPGLAADRLDARGDLLMRAARITGPVVLRGARIGGDLIMDGAELDHPDDRALNAERLSVRGSALFRGTRMRGTLALPGARIGDDLDLFAAHIDRADAVAVDAGGVQINGDLVLRRCEVRGRVELVGAHVPGDADFSGAIITAPGEIALNLNRAEVEGAFFLRHEARIDGALSLNGATLGSIVDDAASWPAPGDLLLNRCRYGGFLAAPVGAEERLDWLSRQDPTRWGDDDFWPQPYEHLARVLGEMGHQDDKRTVLIEKERRQRRIRISRARSWTRKVFLWFSDRLLWLTTAYGRRPLVAVIWIVFFWLAGGVLFAALERTDNIRPNVMVVLRSPEWVLCGATQGETVTLPSLGLDRAGLAAEGQSQLDCWSAQPEAAAFPKFSALMLSADMIFPGLGSGQKDYWSPDTRSLQGYLGKIYAYFQTIAGLALGLLAVAGFTGIVRSD